MSPAVTSAMTNPLCPPRACPAHRSTAVRIASNMTVVTRFIMACLTRRRISTSQADPPAALHRTIAALLDPQLLELRIEILTSNLQQPGGFGLVALGPRQGASDEQALQLSRRVLKRHRQQHMQARLGRGG